MTDYEELDQCARIWLMVGECVAPVLVGFAGMVAGAFSVADVSMSRRFIAM